MNITSGATFTEKSANEFSSVENCMCIIIETYTNKISLNFLNIILNYLC